MSKDVLTHNFTQNRFWLPANRPVFRNCCICLTDYLILIKRLTTIISSQLTGSCRVMGSSDVNQELKKKLLMDGFLWMILVSMWFRDGRILILPVLLSNIIDIRFKRFNQNIWRIFRILYQKRPRGRVSLYVKLFRPENCYFGWMVFW